MGLSVAAFAAVWILAGRVRSQPPDSKDFAPEPAPPAGQTYIGVKRCLSCHPKQCATWQKTKHARKAWEIAPERKWVPAECFPCHATGYGQPTGFKDPESTPELGGVTCEACHGPGSNHEEICHPYIDKQKLDPAEEKIARDSIYKVPPRNVCAACHVGKIGHRSQPTEPEQAQPRS